MGGHEKPSIRSITGGLKRLIAEIKNMSVTNIRVGDSLTTDLHFTTAGLRALAGRINAVPEFAALGVAVTPDEVASAGTVSDLARLVQNSAAPVSGGK